MKCICKNSKRVGRKREQEEESMVLLNIEYFYFKRFSQISKQGDKLKYP